MYQSISYQEMRVRVAHKIRELRLARGLSQEELSERAKMHRTHLGQIERLTKTPSLEAIVNIANALEVDPGVLCTA